MPKSKTCFVIAPIGLPQSATRDRSDKILRWVVKPAAKACGYRAIRADQVPEPGMITPSIVRHLFDDPLVIADLTDQNPNVFYELAIRHMARKPVLNIIERGHEIPFDVSPLRAIDVDYRDIDSMDRCRVELQKQIEALEDDSTRFDNPISLAIDADALHRSSNAAARSNARILTMLGELHSRMVELKDMLRASPYRYAPHPLPSGELPTVWDLLTGKALFTFQEPTGSIGPTGPDPAHWAPATGPTGASGPTGPTGPTATRWAAGPIGPGPSSAGPSGSDAERPTGPTGPVDPDER